MQLGLFTPVFGQHSLAELLVELKRYPHITRLELGTGGWAASAHIDVEALLADRAAAPTYLRQLSDTGLAISALSCHGNPVHPVGELAHRDDETFRRTVQAAELLHVPTVVTFSGCPGGGPADQTPNWITCAWPPEYEQALAWQWEKRLIPYWKEAAAFAAERGVNVALEAHPGFCVYNPETLLRLREAAGPALGINLDPSHLWWQGMNIPEVIASLGEAIFHVHAKDVSLNPREIARNGVLDTKSYRRMQQRSWLFRSVGWGHGVLDWKVIVSSLRLAGYDGVLSIEHEDALLSVHEGLRSAVDLLAGILPKEPPADAWWT